MLLLKDTGRRFPLLSSKPSLLLTSVAFAVSVFNLHFHKFVFKLYVFKIAKVLYIHRLVRSFTAIHFLILFQHFQR